MNFVDRKKEFTRLNALLSSDRPVFVIVRGRRRIGKSALIGRVLTEKDIYFEADRTDAIEQIRLCAQVISAHLPGFADAEYKDWRALLTALNYRVTERFTLCLDEFPYLVENTPALPSIIQGLLENNGLKYHLILCGSSQTMMYNLTHDEQSPLYGRGDSDFNMRPIKLPYLREALGLDAVQTIEDYAVWGGVPRYWKLREGTASVRQAIDMHILSTLGILYEEPQRLFKDDIKDSVKVSTIMSIVGSGVNRLSEIASRLEEPATNLSRPLAKLVDLGYLEKETPFGESSKNSKKNLYRIADPFLSFYYKFVVPNRSFIELERRGPIDLSIENGFSGHVGYWWEHLCREAITGNTINGVLYGEARRWWGKVKIDDEWEDVELDLVAESLDQKTILIGECKWTTGENGRLLTKRLDKIASALPFTQGKDVKTVLFTKLPPVEDVGNTMGPEDIIRLLY
ncbi:MAG: ATP-binding protein [Bacteroidaceae bacterium]|nr:ATP-binding protein [Bacteroidaceae bacterium]MBO7112067.1 ATP-binding protein [Bacteroidaceae bacterium]